MNGTSPPPGQKSQGFLRRHWKSLGAGLVVGVAITLTVSSIAVGWPVGGGSAHGPTSLNFPAGGPAEFLYLDRARVISYLAQVDGGTFASEQLDSRFSESEESHLTLKEIAQLGASHDSEESVSRVVTPTAAADYFELLLDLEHEPGLPGDPAGIQEVSLGRFSSDVAPLREGQFVSFRTHALKPPIYLNPYLASRQRTTMETLYPEPSRVSSDRAAARRRRSRARHFRHELGRNPRVTFELQPLYPKQIKLIRRHQREGRKERVAAEGRAEVGTGHEGPVRAHEPRPERAPRARRTCRRVRHRKRVRGETPKEMRRRQHAVYLMPLDARRLTRERSLIRDGGGEFTVVGKVVRIFPEDGDGETPTYLDSSTRETWEQPLTHAPLRLLCGTDPDCRRLARRRGRTAVWAEIRESRCTDLEALREETEIPVRGAVILPIAIYK